MGTFSELLAADSSGRTGPVCLVSQFAGTLDDEDREALQAALADPGTSAARVYRVLRQMGYPGAEGSVSRHKYGRCTCDPVL